jgi:hypothetical protein
MSCFLERRTSSGAALLGRLATLQGDSASECS